MKVTNKAWDSQAEPVSHSGMCASYITREGDRRMSVSAWAWKRRSTTKRTCCLVKQTFTKVSLPQFEPEAVMKSFSWLLETFEPEAHCLRDPSRQNWLLNPGAIQWLVAWFKWKAAIKTKMGNRRTFVIPPIIGMNRQNLEFAFSGLACPVILCHFSVVCTHMCTHPKRASPPLTFKGPGC